MPTKKLIWGLKTDVCFRYNEATVNIKLMFAYMCTKAKLLGDEEPDMCYYIGIEDLAANAMIEILEEKKKACDQIEEGISVSLRDLEAYGTEVVRYINTQTEEKAFLILSRASTVCMFRNYSDLFEEVDEGDMAIKLRKGKTVEDLKLRF